MCEKQFNEGCRTFIFQHRVKDLPRKLSETTRHKSSRAGTNREDAEKENTHGFLHNCQPPACQGIPVATTDRSEITQCQAKKTGDIEQTHA